MKKGMTQWRKHLLGGLFRESIRESALDDFEERFQALSHEKSPFTAALWYAAQFFINLPSHLANRIHWNGVMLKNHLIVAMRNLFRHRTFSIINIAGLTLGLVCCGLILLWVQDEISYDRFHAGYGRIYRLITNDRLENQETKSAGSPAALGPAIQAQIPEVERFTRVQCGWTGWHLNTGDKYFIQEALCCSDPQFFELFHFPFIYGDPKAALVKPNSLVLTESLARKCFGESNPLGRVMKMNDEDLEITGVIQDPPANSHLRFDYVFPAVNMTRWRHAELDSWEYDQFATYVKLRPGASPEALQEKIARLIHSHMPDSDIRITLQPLKNIHLDSGEINTWMTVYPNPGSRSSVLLFSAIGICILAVACINFMNLSTARSFTRSREIGIRKVSGARRRDLMLQFYAETFIVSGAAFITALPVISALLPAFSTLTRKTITAGTLIRTETVVACLALLVLTVTLSGLYPALFLSSLRPVSLFRQSLTSSLKSRGGLRKGLVVIQFTLMIMLISASLVIYRQVRFMQTRDLGYQHEHIISMVQYGQYYESYEAQQNELLQNPNIVDVSRGVGVTQNSRPITDVSWPGKDPAQETAFHIGGGDYNYIDLFSIKLIQGRNFSPDHPTDENNFIINETAARAMGLDKPVGKTLTVGDWQGTIIGVTADFHSASLHHAIRPTILKLRRGMYVFVKYRPGATATILAALEAHWKKAVPDFPFRYWILNDAVSTYYESEQLIETLLLVFTGLAVTIACLGLFGLASFTTQQRIKEIGVRKVLGASVAGIMGLVTRDFVKWVLLANLFAWPAIWILMERWLQKFAYRITLSGWEMAAAAIFSLAVSLVTVSGQARRAAKSDPVESLRYE